MKFSIPYDVEAFGEVAPGETVTVTGEAVLSDDGNVLELVSVEGVPFEDDDDRNEGEDEDDDEKKKKKKEEKEERKDERKEERTLEKDVAKAEEATDAMGVLNAML